MHVLIACKYEKDQMTNRRKYDDIFFSIISLWDLFRPSRTANSVVHGRISPNFELIQALIYTIVNCSSTSHPPPPSRVPISPALSPLTEQYRKRQVNETKARLSDYTIVTCKYEMNPSKNVRENVMTPFSPL